MKKNLIAVAAVAALSIPAVSQAIPVRPGPYVSGFVGVSGVTNTDATTYTTAGTLNDRVEFDPSINIGGTGGFDFGLVRMEGEVSYKHGEISAVNDQTNNIRYVNTDGSLGALAFMVNTFIDLHNQSPITPYFGGGIGFAALHLEDTYGVPTGGGPLTLLYTQDDTTVFAYQLGAGLEIALNRRLSLDLGYRYFATSTGRFNNDPTHSTEMKFQSHNGAVGIRVKF